KARTASRLALARTGSFNVLAGERSTRTPSKAVSRFSMATISTRESGRRGSNSAITSTSDEPRFSVPRAYEPCRNRWTTPAAFNSGACSRSLAIIWSRSICPMCHIARFPAIGRNSLLPRDVQPRQSRRVQLSPLIVSPEACHCGVSRESSARGLKEGLTFSWDLRDSNFLGWRYIVHFFGQRRRVFVRFAQYV